MKAILLRKNRDGEVIRKPVKIISGPNANGLISFEVLLPDGETSSYSGGTCRIADIEHGKILWANWPDNLLKRVPHAD